MTSLFKLQSLKGSNGNTSFGKQHHTSEFRWQTNLINFYDKSKRAKWEVTPINFQITIIKIAIT